MILALAMQNYFEYTPTIQLEKKTEAPMASLAFSEGVWWGPQGLVELSPQGERQDPDGSGKTTTTVQRCRFGKLNHVGKRKLRNITEP